tara:strand:+ start:16056 stop:16433 length:378 start_codon:yes stop_codon:yes gene_type:complete
MLSDFTKRIEALQDELKEARTLSAQIGGEDVWQAYNLLGDVQSAAEHLRLDLLRQHLKDYPKDYFADYFLATHLFYPSLHTKLARVHAISALSKIGSHHEDAADPNHQSIVNELTRIVQATEELE